MLKLFVICIAKYIGSNKKKVEKPQRQIIHFAKMAQIKTINPNLIVVLLVRVGAIEAIRS